MVATYEQPLSLSLNFFAARAKVKFQGGPVVRCEIGHGQQWVGSDQSQTSNAAAQLRSFWPSRN